MENIFTAVKPFYIFAKFLGLFPMTFEGPMSKGILRVKWYDVAASALAILVPIVIIAVNLIIGDESASSSSLLSNAWTIEAIAGDALVMIIFIYQQLKRQKIEEFLIKLHDFDEKVSAPRITC